MTNYEIILPAGMAQELRTHLLTDRSKEQMAVVLCGVQRLPDRVRLLGRHLFAMPSAAFSRQSSVGLELAPSVQQQLLKQAAQEGLSQVDFHTHPGDGPSVAFSGVDDRNESVLAQYLADRLPGTIYASVVTNATAMAARVWHATDHVIVATDIPSPTLESEFRPFVGINGGSMPTIDGARFDRQVRAFGVEFQNRLASLTVGLVGAGGLGSIIVEQLTRLGVRNWVLVDPDVVDVSNLNRLIGAMQIDAVEEISKVDIATRSIKQIDVDARVQSVRSTVFTERALRALSACDLLVAATDDDASRLTLNALACQYLIPLLHAGVNLDVDDDGDFDDISGEVVVPPIGRWCLLCAGVIDSQRAAWDLARPEERMLLQARGYLPGTPAPAVAHLNGVIASLAVTEIHNLVQPYKELRRYLAYNEIEADLMPIDVPATQNCLHCGPEGLLGLGDLVPVWRPDRRRSALPVPAAEPQFEKDAESQAYVDGDRAGQGA